MAGVMLVRLAMMMMLQLDNCMPVDVSRQGLQYRFQVCACLRRYNLEMIQQHYHQAMTVVVVVYVCLYVSTICDR